MDIRPVCAIDIGNSTTRVGLVDCSTRTCLKRRDLPTSDAAARLTAALSGMLGADPEAVVAACVAPGAWETVLSWAAQARCTVPVRRVEYAGTLPIRVVYDSPESLGADRLADLLYAHVVNPSSDTIVVDAGTAITIDLLRNGAEFAGGAILPGPDSQLAALHGSTALLPRLMERDLPDRFPGASTAGCMAAGVREGIAGAISHIVRRLREQASGECSVLATGGAWPLCGSRVDFAFRHVPDLTLIGTGLFHQLTR